MHVVITGAIRGIGQELAMHFEAAGTEVTKTSRSVNAETHTLDLADAEERKKAIQLYSETVRSMYACWTRIRIQPDPNSPRKTGLEYAELLRSRRCRLVVVGVEVGGRWSEEALTFIRLMAKAKSRAYPRLLRASAQMAYTTRWTGLLAVAAHRALAATLLEIPVAAEPPRQVVVRRALR